MCVGELWSGNDANPPPFFFNAYASSVNTEALDAAIAAIPDDLSMFTEESIEELQLAQDAVNLDDPNLTQQMVDDWADEIDSAIRSLTYAHTIGVGSKVYDGTNQIDIHVPYFGGQFYQDDIYGDANGTVSSPNAGHYTVCDWTNLVPGGADTMWYDFTEIINATNREADITITKAIANVSITMPDEVTEGKEFQVEFTIDNTFNYLEGLPTADQISFISDDATVKNVVKKDNLYTATIVANKSIKTDEINVYVEISDEAQNYEQGSELVASAEVIHVETEEADDQKPQGSVENTDNNKSEDKSESSNKTEDKPSKLAKTNDETPYVALVALAVSALAGLGVSRFVLKK